MKTSRMLAAAAATAGLLAAGCDYWKNLVDDKSITLVPLSIRVDDAFTGLPLAAHCTDSARGLEFNTDATGEYFLGEAQTGHYSLHCGTAQWYYDLSLGFDVPGKGDTVRATMGLARHGGDEWYPEDPDKKIRIVGKPDAFRFPLSFKMRAFPEIDNGTFRFEWRFANNPWLNQSFSRESAGRSYFNLNAAAPKLKEGEDTITLTVKSRLAGHEEYLVDSATVPILWVRNQLPFFVALTPNTLSAQVGCGPIEDSIFLGFEGADPDGRCDSVVFDSPDSASAIGKLHVYRSCSDPKPLILSLKNPFGPPQDQILKSINKLSVSVYDDNKEHQDTILQFITKSNSLPTVTSGKLSHGTVFFVNEPVTYWIAAQDSDGPVYDMAINWGDGEQPKLELKNYPAHFAADTLTHSYLFPSDSVFVKAIAVDNCRETRYFENKDPLTIRKDINPSIALNPQKSDYTLLAGKPNFQVELTVTDKDVRDNLDRFTQISIDWGDSTVEDTSTQIGEEFAKLLRHNYSHPPAEGERKLRVEAFDAHRGRSEVTLAVPAYAPGAPAPIKAAAAPSAAAPPPPGVRSIPAPKP